jgi:hypothetical protein
MIYKYNWDEWSVERHVVWNIPLYSLFFHKKCSKKGKHSRQALEDFRCSNCGEEIPDQIRIAVKIGDRLKGFNNVR